MIEKEFPGGEGLLDTRFLYVFCEGAAREKVVKAVLRLSVLVFSVADVSVLLVGLHAEDVIVAIALAESAVMEEIVAHPDVDHRCLR